MSTEYMLLEVNIIWVGSFACSKWLRVGSFTSFSKRLSPMKILEAFSRSNRTSLG